MKKVKFIVSAIFRNALLLAPGAVFGWWAWPKAAALIAILAAVGVETLSIIALSFIAVVIQARKDLKRQAAEESAAEETQE